MQERAQVAKPRVRRTGRSTDRGARQLERGRVRDEELGRKLPHERHAARERPPVEVGMAGELEDRAPEARHFGEARQVARRVRVSRRIARLRSRDAVVL